MAADLPRVTTILNAVGLGPDLSMVPPDVLTAAQQRGTAVHEAIEAIVYGYFDGAPDASIKGYLDAYQRFVAESGYTPIAAEFEVVHEAWRYVGHPDQIGWLGKHRILLDFKTGIADGVEYQLAAYAAAYNAQHPTEPVTAAAAIALRRDGTYRYHEVDVEEAKPVWLAAVTVYHARMRRAA